MIQTPSRWKHRVVWALVGISAIETSYFFSQLVVWWLGAFVAALFAVATYEVIADNW